MVEWEKVREGDCFVVVNLIKAYRKLGFFFPTTFKDENLFLTSGLCIHSGTQVVQQPNLATP